MIQLENIGKVYHASDGDHRALEGVNLTIDDGDVFGIIGESGAGKSTLVRLLNLLERPTEGRIVIDGADITGYRGRDLRELRASIGMIFQNFSLFDQRTVLQNVMFPLELRREPKSASRQRAHELLGLVGLDDKASRYPSELSGGQQQRVAIARALANQPRYMLCDEATSALDSRTTVQVLDLLARINAEMGVTMVLITHSLAVAKRACNRIAVIDAGHIVEEGATEDVFANPRSKVARELLGWGVEGPKRMTEALSDIPDEGAPPAEDAWTAGGVRIAEGAPPVEGAPSAEDVQTLEGVRFAEAAPVAASGKGGVR